jgi:hypothetical protein
VRATALAFLAVRALAIAVLAHYILFPHQLQTDTRMVLPSCMIVAFTGSCCPLGELSHAFLAIMHLVAVGPVPERP